MSDVWRNIRDFARGIVHIGRHQPLDPKKGELWVDESTDRYAAEDPHSYDAHEYGKHPEFLNHRPITHHFEFNQDDGLPVISFPDSEIIELYIDKMKRPDSGESETGYFQLYDDDSGQWNHKSHAWVRREVDRNGTSSNGADGGGADADTEVPFTSHVSPFNSETPNSLRLRIVEPHTQNATSISWHGTVRVDWVSGGFQLRGGAPSPKMRFYLDDSGTKVPFEEFSGYMVKYPKY